MRPVWRWIALAAVGAGWLAGVAAARHMDSGNTQVVFQINHLGLRWFSAAFRELNGEFELDQDGRAHLSVTVSMASIDCHSTFWDEKLRSPQWFDSGRYPQMVYRSSHIDFQGEGRATVYGELSLHGMTQPVTLAVSDIDCPQPAAAAPAVCRFVGHAQLKRSDFGLSHGFWQGGDFVEIIVRGI